MHREIDCNYAKCSTAIKMMSMPSSLFSFPYISNFLIKCSITNKKWQDHEVDPLYGTTMSFWCNIKALHTARISKLNLLILHLIIWSICLCHNISGGIVVLETVVKKFSLVYYVQCWIYVNARATRYDWIQFYIFVDILKWLRIVEWNDNNENRLQISRRDIQL